MIQLSAIDLWHICREAKETLLDSKLDQIYQYDAQTLLLRFHKTTVGKKEMHIHVPRALFLTAKKPPVAKHLSFCSYLRKTIKGAYLTDMGLLGFSRTVYFTFTFKEKSFKLICEFYDKGNIILCTQNEKGEYIIELPSQLQEWSSRSIKKGEIFAVDEIPFPHEVTEEQFNSFVEEASRKEVTPSKFFATKYKLGGFYSKYICHTLNIDDTKPLSSLQFSEVQTALKTLFSEDASKYKPRAYVSTSGDIKSASHVSPLDVFSKKDFIEGNTICELLDAYYAQEQSSEYEDAKTKMYDKKVLKLQRILDAQRKVEIKLQKQIKTNTEKANTLQANAYAADTIIKEYVAKGTCAALISQNRKLKTIKVNI